MEALLIFFSQFSIIEYVMISTILILFGIVVYMFLKIKKLSYDFYSKSVSKTIEKQSEKILSLEKQIQLYKREDTGVILKWAPPREDKSAYLLTLYNDSAEKIFNIKVKIDSAYTSHCRIFYEKQICDSEKQLLIFFIPGGWPELPESPNISRIGFVETWLRNNLRPINITVEYTKTPIANDKTQTVSILFSTDQITDHLKKRIEAMKSRLRLSSVKK